VTHVYNPLHYAALLTEQYLERYGFAHEETLLLGMNPGPFGMAQTGVPFGDVSIVRDWLQIEGKVKKPRPEHPKRLVEGLDCSRSEVSGTRLWGWAKERFKTPDKFFKKYFVWNYCPLCFMEESGKNRTPDKLPKEERERLFAFCDQALVAVIEELRPKVVVGIGKFAEERALSVCPATTEVRYGLHPSPASPAANRNWQETFEQQLR